jgi:hypothetical protein
MTPAHRRLGVADGFSTRSGPGNFRRPKMYWMTPNVMPMPAAPKPHRQLTFACRKPQTMGPRAAPALIPM